MKKILSLILTVMLIIGAIPFSEVSAEASVGTTYYIDDINGSDENSGKSEAEAWKSLDKINNTVFSAGDKILFKSGGIWNGRLMPQGSGAHGAPIVIDKYGGDKRPVINGGGSSTLDGGLEGSAVLLYNQEYWEIYNLEVTNISSSANAECEGIWVIAKDFGVADHFVISNCYIHDLTSNWRAGTKNAVLANGEFTDNLVGDGLGTGAIAFKAAAGGELIPTRFNDITITNNTLHDTGTMTSGITVGSEWTNDQIAGFYDKWADVYYSTNVYIANNILYNTAAAITLAGLDGSVGNGVIIEHNVAHDNNESSSHWVFWHTHTKDVLWQFNEVYDYDNGGNGDGGCFDTDGNTEGTIFQYNYSRNIRAGVFTFCDVTWAPEKFNYHFVNDCVYRYNISQNDNWGSFKNEGTFHGAGGNGYIYNNVIYVEGYDNVILDFPIEETNEHHIYNNIFYYVDGNATNVANEGKGKVYVENNCFYGVDMPTEDGTNYVMSGNISADPLFVNPGKGSIGFETLTGYMLKDGSPCIGAGRIVENNGGRDFWGNPVSETENPTIGAYQPAISNTTVRTEAKGLAASKIGEEEFTLSWEKATDSAALARYVIYLDGKPYKNMLTNGREGVMDTTQVVDGLMPNTTYSVSVRTYYYDGTYKDSEAVNVTTKAVTSTLMHIENIKSYSHDMNTATISPSTSFSAGDVLHFKAVVVDANGNPVRNARVELQYRANGFQYAEFDATTSDNNGIIEFGTRAEYFPKAALSYTVSVIDVIKNGYSYDKTNSRNMTSLTVSVSGYNEEFSGNLMYNGGFEDLNSRGTPVDWSIVNTNSASAVNILEDAGHDGGEHIVDMRSSASCTAFIQQIISDIPNGTYNLTLWVRNSNSATLITVANNGDDAREVSVPINEEWAQISINNILVTTGEMRLRITSAFSGDYALYTQIDDVELTRNLMLNTELQDIYPISGATLPANYYYTTDSSSINYDDLNLESYFSDASLQAVSIHNFVGEGYTNVVRVSSDKGFKVSMGQHKEGLTSDSYTFSVYSKSTGGIKGELRVFDGSRNLLGSTAIQSSDVFKVTKISGINTTDGEVYAELYFEGEGSAEDYIEFYRADFSCRSDIPGNEEMLVVPGQNLLVNSNYDFEDDGSETQDAPASWVNDPYVGNGKAYVSAEEAYTGNFSMKITLDEEGYHNPKPGIYTQFGTAPITSFTNLPSGIYTFTWYEKSDFRYKLTVKTENGNKSYQSNSIADGNWNKITINNIEVTDGTLSFSLWCTKDSTSPKEMQYAYIDNLSLYMNPSLVTNGNMETTKSGMPTNWGIAFAENYAEALSSKDAFAGDSSIKAVLPGSDSAITVSTVNETKISGTYDFSARVKGNAQVRFAIKPIASDNIVYTDYVTASDIWQKIEVQDITFISGIEKIWFEAKNQTDWTSGYVCVDEVNVARKVTAQNIADTLPRFSAVYQTETALTLPEPVIEGYTVELVDSSNKSVITLDGAIITPTDDTIASVTLKVTNNSDSSDIAYITKLVSVYGKNT